MVQRLLSKVSRCEQGASAVEYSLLIGLLALALFGAVTAVGEVTHENFNAAAESYPDS